MAPRQIIHNLRPQATVSGIAIMCAVVFCLSFLFSQKAQATSAEEIVLRYNSNDILSFIEFNDHYSYFSNSNCVGVYMPNGEQRFL